MSSLKLNITILKLIVVKISRKFYQTTLWGKCWVIQNSWSSSKNSKILSKPWQTKQNKIQSLFRSTSSMKSTAYFDWKNKKIGLKKSAHSLLVPHYFKFNYQFTKKSWCALKSLKHHKKNLFKKFVVKQIPVIFCWTHQEKKIIIILLFRILQHGS